jgi:CRP/FNR family transcriptional regulator
MARGSEFSMHCQRHRFSHLCLALNLHEVVLASLDEITSEKAPFTRLTD